MAKPDIDLLLNSQQNLCFLCHKEVSLGKYLGVVDHCHTTGKVRGILCHTCNIFVGYIENKSIPHERLISYLS